MGKTTKKFIESHWLTFVLKGAISIVASLCLMFANGGDTETLIQFVGWTMIALGVIELANMLHRSHKQRNWGFPLLLGLLEIGIAISLLVTAIPGVGSADLIWLRIAILSGYVLFASIATIFIGFGSFANRTDQFMWVVNGMLGAILAFVMLAGSGYNALAHINFFGIYLLINGLTDLFFGVHTHDEMLELQEKRNAKRLANKKAKK